MQIATWNVNSITVRLTHLLDWLKLHNPDVVCLQETKITDDKFPREAFAELGYHCQFRGEKSYNGVAIISKTVGTSVQKEFHKEAEPSQARYIAGKFGSINILNVYVPNGSYVGSEKFIYKLKWLSHLKKHLDASYKPSDLVLLCGDFNIATEPRDVYDPEAMEGQIMFSREEKEILETVKQWGFVDTFRKLNQEGNQYTWWDYRQGAFRRNMGWRIDHIWTTEALASLCKRVWIDKEPRKLERPSDHVPVVAEFAL